MTGAGRGTTVRHMRPVRSTIPLLAISTVAAIAPQPSAAATATRTVTIYLVRGEKLAAAHRTVPATPAIATAALRELLRGPTAAERRVGLGTTIPSGTRLRGISIAAGVARIDLTGRYDDGGGSLGMFLRLGQVVYTLTAFDTVRSVRFALDGRDVTTFSSEGIVLDHPQRRTDYEEQTPQILVENPAPYDAVNRRFRLRGTANVFEATVHYDVVAGGRRLASGFLTATCGSGCRGTFARRITLPVERPWRATLAVWSPSAKDGSRQFEVRIPLRLRH